MSLATVQQRSIQRRGGVLQGCLIALAVALLIAIIAGIWVSKSWRGWMVGPMKAGVSAVVDSTDLPTDQRDRIVARTDELFDDFKAKEISLPQLGSVMQYVLEDSNFISIVQMAGIEEAINGTGMTDEEKTGANRTVQRFTRGVVEGSIDVDLESLLSPIMVETTDENGMTSQTVKEDLTADDLNAILATMQTEVDGAGIPDEAYEVDYADLVDDAITKGLENAGATVDGEGDADDGGA